MDKMFNKDEEIGCLQICGKHPCKHPPIGCKYTKYNLVPHFIGDFFVSLYCPL